MTNNTNNPNNNDGTNANGPLTIRTPADVAVLATHTLGFVPSDSLVLVGIGARVPTSRVDFPTSPEMLLDTLTALGQAYARNRTPEARIILIGWTNDTHRVREVLPAVAAMLADVAPVVLAIQVHDGIQPAEAWTDHSDALSETPDLIGPWPSGPITTADRDRIGVHFVGRPGATPAASRAARAEALAHDPEAAEATQAAMQTSQDPAESSSDLLDLIEQAGDQTSPLPVDTVARLVLSLADQNAFAGLVTTVRRANAARHHHLWLEVARRTPSTHRQAPLALVALTAWLIGDGATGWLAVDAFDALADTAADADAEPHPLVEVVRTALTQGHHPDNWERAILDDD